MELDQVQRLFKAFFGLGIVLSLELYFPQNAYDFCHLQMVVFINSVVNPHRLDQAVFACSQTLLLGLFTGFICRSLHEVPSFFSEDICFEFQRLVWVDLLLLLGNGEALVENSVGVLERPVLRFELRLSDFEPTKLIGLFSLGSKSQERVLGGDVGGFVDESLAKLVLALFGVHLGKALEASRQVDIVFELEVLGALDGLFEIVFAEAVIALVQFLIAQLPVDARSLLGVDCRS